MQAGEGLARSSGDLKIPRRYIRLMRSAALNAISTRHTWIGGLLVVLLLISFTGCQLLGKQQQQVNDSVVVGSAGVDFGKVAVGSKKTIQNTLTSFKASS